MNIRRIISLYAAVVFPSVLFVNSANALSILPTCEINSSALTIEVTDGYDDYLANLQGSDLEYIAPAIDPSNWSKLNARTYDLKDLPVMPSSPTVAQKDEVDTAWQDRNQLYAIELPQELLSTEILSKNELITITDIIYNGGGTPGIPPARTKVFSEPVHFGTARIVSGDKTTPYRNEYIPRAVYKFWGLFVPKQSGQFKVRFQKDDGLIVHINLGQGNGMEIVLDDFLPGDFVENQPEFNSITVNARNGGDIDIGTDGTDVFDFVSGQAYPIHMQWFNYDGPHALRMQYALSSGNDWQNVPADWFNPGTDPRGIDTIELSKMPSNLDLNIPFTQGDETASGSYSQIDDEKGGVEDIVVTNLAGFQTTCSVTLTGSPVEIPPVAEAKVSTDDKPLLVSSIDVLLGEKITFTGENSSDADGSIVSYSWTLSDGVTTKNTESFTRSYDAVGTYTATLIVTDNDGLNSTPQIVTVNVSALKVIDIMPPLCSLNINGQIASGTADDERLDEDTNGDGQLNNGETDSNNNGKIDYNSGIASIELASSSSNLSLNLTNPLAVGDLTASYSVTLINSNNNGTGSIVVKDVAGNQCSQNVTLASSLAPIAVINVQDALGNPIGYITKTDENSGAEINVYTVNQGDLALLMGGNSTDKDGNIVSYLWSGVQSNAQKINVTELFVSKNEKTFSLTVTDNDGLTDTAKIIIRVNEAPFIDIGKINISYGDGGSISDDDRTNFTVSDDTILTEEGRTIILDASGSYDDSKIDSYVWCPTVYFNEIDKTCDAPEDKAYLVGTSMKYEYTASGQKSEQMTLILTDEYGAKSAGTFTIERYLPVYEAGGSFSYWILLLSPFIYIRRFKKVVSR